VISHRVCLLGVALVVTALVGPVTYAQAPSRHPIAQSADADWEDWAGHETAFVIARLGTADRVVGHAWHYRNVVVGNEQTGPYTRWDLTIDVRDGHVVSVTAVRTGGAGCIVVE
jgi:hypothetical protein